jgi:hypothetical protein
MNFETWWNSYQKELHELFQGTCEIEILARVKQVAERAYDEGYKDADAWGSEDVRWNR